MYARRLLYQVSACIPPEPQYDDIIFEETEIMALGLYPSLVMHISNVDMTILYSYYWLRSRLGDWNADMSCNHCLVKNICFWSAED
jgi:hypothetical protein